MLSCHVPYSPLWTLYCKPWGGIGFLASDLYLCLNWTGFEGCMQKENKRTRICKMPDWLCMFLLIFSYYIHLLFFLRIKRIELISFSWKFLTEDFIPTRTLTNFRKKQLASYHIGLFWPSPYILYSKVSHHLTLSIRIGGDLIRSQYGKLFICVQGLILKDRI